MALRPEAGLGERKARACFRRASNRLRCSDRLPPCGRWRAVQPAGPAPGVPRGGCHWTRAAAAADGLARRGAMDWRAVRCPVHPALRPQGGVSLHRFMACPQQHSTGPRRQPTEAEHGSGLRTHVTVTRADFSDSMRWPSHGAADAPSDRERSAQVTPCCAAGSLRDGGGPARRPADPASAPGDPAAGGLRDHRGLR